MFVEENSFSCAVACGRPSFVSEVSHAGSRWGGQGALLVWKAERSTRALSEPRDLRKNLWWGKKPQDVGDL